MQFRRFHQKLEYWWKNGPKSENVKITFFFSGKKCFSAKLFYGHVECIFNNTAKNNLPEAAKKSIDVRKRKKNDFSQNNKYILPQIVPLDT